MIIPAPGTAAVPIDAKTAVATIVNWSAKVRSIPIACAINTAATPWYKAVPSILIVAPKGKTNEDISSDTPKSFSQRFIVTGSVAPLELVENANSCTGAIDLKKCFKSILVNIFNMVRYVIPICMNNPKTTTPI